MKKLMKSQILTLVLAMFTLPLFAQISVGGGVAFGSEIENLGFTAKSTYSINEQWEGAASFTYFIPKSFGTIDWTLWALNADGHYLKNINEKFTIYPLAGLSIGGFTLDNNFSFGGVDGGKRTTTEVGINLGGGAYLGISEKMKGYAEIKYIVGGFDQLVLNAGVLFNL